MASTPKPTVTTARSDGATNPSTRWCEPEHLPRANASASRRSLHF
jgi:hypothetical protein